ncbi:MAG: HAMP domain-containing protein [Myxococcales bacterium]|nr:HAMP domain-containing protein [Myxococcales bacterium]
MMPLLLRIALSVFVAFIVGLIPIELWFNRFENDVRSALHIALKADVEAVAAELRALRPSERAVRLSHLQSAVAVPLQLMEGDTAIQPPAATPQAAETPTPERANPGGIDAPPARGGLGPARGPLPPPPPFHPSIPEPPLLPPGMPDDLIASLGAPGYADISVDIGDGQRLMVVGPRAPAGRRMPFQGPPPVLIGLMLVVVLVASLIVGIPLIRRIRRVETALNALAAGDFSARVPVPRADTLGGLPVALNRCAERLERLFEARKELLEAVSHEIGTPLSRMRFQLELLATSSSEDAHRSRVDALAGEITELDALSSELVQWVEADGAAIHAVAIPAEPFLPDLVAAEQFACERPLSVQVTVASGLVFHGEPRQLGRALENVVRNALDYGREHVEVFASAEEGGVLVIVRDDGLGIPEAARERVLQPFERLDRSRSRDRGGIGLGLAITRRIVERHGGRIVIATAPLGGAELRVWLPSHSATAA